MKYSKPRVLIVSDISGIASSFRDYLRMKDFNVDVLNYFHRPLFPRADIQFDLKNGHLFLEFFKMLFNFIRSIIRYDIFIFYFGRSLFPWRDIKNNDFLPIYFDLYILKLLKKKMIMNYVGSEIRCSQLTNKLLGLKTKYIFCEKCEYGEYEECLDSIKRRREIKMVEKYIDFIFASKKNIGSKLLMREFIQIVVPINLDKWTMPEITKNKIPIIIHAPSERNVKGTEQVLEAVNKLKRAYSFEFLLCENMQNEILMESLKRSDIVLDQFVWGGGYGRFAIESMALGKPVLTYIKCLSKKQQQGILPKDLPIVNTSAEKIFDNVKYLLEHPEERKIIGDKSRKYVEKYHDIEKNTTKLFSMLGMDFSD